MKLRLHHLLLTTLLLPVLIGGCSSDESSGDKPAANPAAQLTEDKAYLGLTPPGIEPEVFGRGLVSRSNTLEFGPSFTPSGREFFFTSRTPGRYNQMFYMKFEDTGWAGPTLAPFAMDYGDFEPSVTPDGTRIYFGSVRPLPGQTELNMNPDIWYVNWEDTAWGTPLHFADNMFHLSFTRNLTMYYSYWSGDDRPGTIAYRKVVDYQYGPEQRLDDLYEFFSDTHQPAVALDESYLLFSAPADSDNTGGLDIYVSFRGADGVWQEPINMGETVNSILDESAPAISPDGKYLFFTRISGQTGDIYWISSEILDSLRP